MQVGAATAEQPFHRLGNLAESRKGRPSPALPQDTGLCAIPYLKRREFRRMGPRMGWLSKG